MSKFLFITISVIFALQLCAQPYTVENGKTRHRFAQLEIGLANYVNPTGGLLGNKEIGFSTTPAFFIGGTHFWGHCDFAVTIPFGTVGKGMAYGVDLQAKYYPWRIEKNKIRPFAGVSLSPFKFKYEDGPKYSKIYFPIVAGLNYMKGANQFEIGVIYNYNNEFKYDISRTELASGKIPIIYSLTYKLTLETTVGTEKGWRDGSTKARTEELAAAGKLDNFSLAIGPTTAFNIKESSYLNEKYPFAGQHDHRATIELGAGYYWHKPDFHVNLAYRTFKSDIDAYGYSQKARTRLLTLEAYKFLFDYHGFLPFVGPNISYTNLSIDEKDRTNPAISNNFKGLKPGVTFGWDIRPNRLQPWILRTNLRWNPNLNVDMKPGGQSALDNLEFNFIQLVVYPGRFKN
jgi:hypothetical protein